MNAANDTPIRIDNLVKVFGSRPNEALSLLDEGKSRAEIKEQTGQLVALRDASFSVKKGEIFVIMGLSGSGKSTLLRCINRLHEPTRGTVSIHGENIRSLSERALNNLRQDHIGMVFQRFALLPHRTVLENATFGLEIKRMSRTERQQRGKDVLERVGLSEWAHSPISELSGGMQQRVGLARALAIDAEILLMDEPFSALDPLIRDTMQNELLRLQQELSKTICFVTHDLNEAIRIGDRIAILDSEGSIVQLDTPEQILLSPATEYVETFTKNVDRAAALRLESVMESPTEEAKARAQNGESRLAPVKTILPRLLEEDAVVPVLEEDGSVVGQVHKDAVIRVLA